MQSERHRKQMYLLIEVLELDAEGRALPTGDEQARAAEEKARTAQDEAKLLAARLAAYEQRFGKLPSGESP
ncbi:hypothetical protein [Sorangium sp. So ce1151]|uniref:hypothetical protein n=1 Tax=Sorangium sp. So ce1151 TaxID=3133332 RepID=UPI003F6104DA